MLLRLYAAAWEIGTKRSFLLAWNRNAALPAVSKQCSISIYFLEILLSTT